jgi:hypothetical protein
MDFEQFKWGAVCVGMGACLAHLLFSGKVWRYRIVAHGFHGAKTMWLPQRRLVFWPFWFSLHYHSATGHEWVPTAYSSEDDAVRSMPHGCEFYVVRKMVRPL